MEQPPGTSEAETPDRKENQTNKRQATLYDAVAGRVTNQHLGPSASTKFRDGMYLLRNVTLAPEDVLFRRRGAPQRYAEKDIYHSQHEAVPDAQLPDSDLLKAVHGYAANFYEQLGKPGPGRGADEAQADCFVGSRHVDERSMDETALIAFGILLEEAAREALGRRGDLVFTEGLADDGQPERASSHRCATPDQRDGQDAFWRRSYPKRRKMRDAKRAADIP